MLTVSFCRLISRYNLYDHCILVLYSSLTDLLYVVYCNGSADACSLRILINYLNTLNVNGPSNL